MKKIKYRPAGRFSTGRQTMQRKEKHSGSLQKMQNGNPEDGKTGATNLIGFYALCRSCRCTFRHCVKEQSVRLKPDGSKVLVGRVKCPECGSDDTEVQDFQGD